VHQKRLFRTLGPLGLWSKPKKHEKKKESFGMFIINNKEIKKMVVVYVKNYIIINVRFSIEETC